jgi:hypothetical protein
MRMQQHRHGADAMVDESHPVVVAGLVHAIQVHDPVGARPVSQFVNRHRGLNALFTPHDSLTGAAIAAMRNGSTAFSAAIPNAIGPTTAMNPAKFGRRRHCDSACSRPESTANPAVALRLPRLPSIGNRMKPPRIDPAIEPQTLSE